MKNYLLIILVLILSSCNNWVVDKSPGDSNHENFESMWSTIDQRYSFFEYKRINWDSIKSEYEKRLFSSMSQEALADVLGDMISELQDGHVNLSSPYDYHRNWDWYLNFPPNFDRNIAERNYWGKDYRIGTGSIRHNFLKDTMTDIGYLFLPSFSVFLNNAELDIILQKYATTKGLIVDIRDNGGGFLTTAHQLADRFADRERLGYKSISKTGPAHNQFSNPEDFNVAPSDNFRYQGKVMLLTNRRCFSSSTTFTALMRALPNVLVIGDRTGGGGGTPADFELPNGWVYRFSVTQTYIPESSLPTGYLEDPDSVFASYDKIYPELGFNVEFGIPVDISVEQTPEDLANGIDPIIEQAVIEIRR